MSRPKCVKLLIACVALAAACNTDGAVSGPRARPVNDGGTSGAAPAPDPNDADDGQGLPDCSNATTEGRRAWCAGTPATDDSIRTKRIKDALQKMRTQGSGCDSLADLGDSLLAKRTLKIYPEGQFRGGGWSDLGSGINGYLALDAAWTDRYYDDYHVAVQFDSTLGVYNYMTLQTSLAHELDHLKGREHNNANTPREDRYNTPNTQRCGENWAAIIDWSRNVPSVSAAPAAHQPASAGRRRRLAGPGARP